MVGVWYRALIAGQGLVFLASDHGVGGHFIAIGNGAVEGVHQQLQGHGVGVVAGCRQWYEIIFVVTDQVEPSRCGEQGTVKFLPVIFRDLDIADGGCRGDQGFCTDRQVFNPFKMVNSALLINDEIAFVKGFQGSGFAGDEPGRKLEAGIFQGGGESLAEFFIDTSGLRDDEFKPLVSYAEHFVRVIQDRFIFPGVEKRVELDLWVAIREHAWQQLNTLATALDDILIVTDSVDKDWQFPQLIQIFPVEKWQMFFKFLAIEFFAGFVTVAEAV